MKKILISVLLVSGIAQAINNTDRLLASASVASKSIGFFPCVLGGWASGNCFSDLAPTDDLSRIAIISLVSGYVLKLISEKLAHTIKNQETREKIQKINDTIGNATIYASVGTFVLGFPIKEIKQKLINSLIDILLD